MGKKHRRLRTIRKSLLRRWYPAKTHDDLAFMNYITLVEDANVLYHLENLIKEEVRKRERDTPVST